MSGLGPLQSSPPTENPKRVLKRPPILGDYINVTSSEGTRVFMAVRDDSSHIGIEVRGPPSSSGALMVHGTCAEHQHVLCSSQLRDSVGWNRPLHLLGVPFTYLKEQVYEEVLLLPDSPRPHSPIITGWWGVPDPSHPVCAPAPEESRGSITAVDGDNKQVRSGQLLSSPRSQL